MAQELNKSVIDQITSLKHPLKKSSIDFNECSHDFLVQEGLRSPLIKNTKKYHKSTEEKKALKKAKKFFSFENRNISGNIKPKRDISPKKLTIHVKNEASTIHDAKKFFKTTYTWWCKEEEIADYINQLTSKKLKIITRSARVRREGIFLIWLHLGNLKLAFFSVFLFSNLFTNPLKDLFEKKFEILLNFLELRIDLIY